MAAIRREAATTTFGSSFRKESFPSSPDGFERQMVRFYASQYREALSKPVSDMASLCREMLAIDLTANKPLFVRKSALLGEAIPKLNSLYGTSGDKPSAENLLCVSLSDALNTPLMLLGTANALAKAAALSGNLGKVAQHKLKLEKALVQVESIISCLQVPDSLAIVPNESYSFVLQFKTAAAADSAAAGAASAGRTLTTV